MNYFENKIKSHIFCKLCFHIKPINKSGQYINAFKQYDNR